MRVTPSNADLVTALHEYARGRDELEEAVLVYDQQPPDLHVATLTAAFQERFARELGTNPPQPFHGETLTEDAPPALFEAAVRNVCQMEADMVLFSGRIGDLDSFLDALRDRPCQDLPLSLLFADNGPLPDVGDHRQLARQNLTVVQASATDPAWSEEGVRSPGAPSGFAGFLEAYASHVDYERDVGNALTDGYATANHDAVAVAVEAVRMSHQRDTASPMTGVRVREALMLLNSANAVQAAGGTLHFRIDRDGDPGCKPIAVLEAPPGKEQPATYETPGCGEPRGEEVEVDRRRVELLTSAMQRRRSTN